MSNSLKTTRRATIVGGGISGLTAGFRLQQQGYEVTVLESSDHIAGKMATLRRDGFTINRGATVVPASYRAFRALAVEVGLGDQLEPFAATLKVPRDGTMHELKVSGLGALIDAWRTGLVSARAKLTLLKVGQDALALRSAMSYTDHAARAAVDTESIGEYCARRLSREAHDWLIDPLSRGLWVQDSDPLAKVDLFFALVQMFGPGMLRYPPGVDFLCRALADRLDVRLHTAVTEVRREGQRVTVRFLSDDGSGEEEADACVIAVSATAVPGIHPGLHDRQRELLEREIVYGDTIAAHFALNRRPPGEQLAYVLPASFDDGLGIVPFSHISMPGCAPEGKGLISGYWTGRWSTSHFDDDEDTLLAQMIPAVERVVPGLSEMIEFAIVERWRPSTLLSRPGMHRHIAEFASLIDPGDPIQLAGDYFGPPNIESCVLSAEAAVRNLGPAAATLGRVVPVSAA